MPASILSIESPRRPALSAEIRDLFAYMPLHQQQAVVDMARELVAANKRNARAYNRAESLLVMMDEAERLAGACPPPAEEF